MKPAVLSLVIALMFTCTPSLVVGQAQGPAISPEQHAFVSSAYEWLLVAHAQEEGALSAAITEESRRIAELERDSARLNLERAEAERILERRTREVEAARAAWEKVRGPLGGIHGASPGHGIVRTAEQAYAAQIRARAAAAARLQNLDTQRAEVGRSLLASREVRTLAQEKLVTARQENQVDLSEFTNARQAWVNSAVPTGEFWGRLTQVITETAAENGAEATVTFKSQPQSGIVLYYQTIDDRKKGKTPRSINNPTQTTAPLPIGIYHIWHEQNGVAKSDRNREYDIIKKHVEITVNVTP